MTTFERVKELIPAMTGQEKLRLIGLLAQDLQGSVPGIERTPGICGGSARIAGTRIPVWAIVQYTQLGVNQAELLEAYPTIRADDLASNPANIAASFSVPPTATLPVKPGASTTQSTHRKH